MKNPLKFDPIVNKPKSKRKISKFAIPSFLTSGFVLTLILIALKATNTVDIEWIWVFAPLWIPTIALLTFISLVAFTIFIDALNEKRKMYKF